MDHHINEFFRQASDEAPQGHFHSVIALHDASDISWKAISKLVPHLCRGWFELSQLSSKDRIEFTHDFWMTKLSYQPGLDAFIDRFFASLDEIGIFITQKKYDDPYEVDLVYSLKNNDGFYRGAPPITEERQKKLQSFFSNFTLPADYLAFLQIHDGFCKTTDCTGLIKSVNMPDAHNTLQYIMQQHEPIMTSKGTEVNPKTLIPFYESFGMPFFQCFWSEWYPDHEMGNVYYSGTAGSISDVFKGRAGADIMAFPSFTDWLIFYLERIE